MNTDQSTVEVKTVLDKYFQKEISFPADEIDAVQGFFMKRGFATDATRSLAIVMLNQASIDRVNVFQLLDKLNNVSDLHLSQIINDVLNAYRDISSVLGYKEIIADDSLESRNILI